MNGIARGSTCPDQGPSEGVVGGHVLGSDLVGDPGKVDGSLGVVGAVGLEGREVEIGDVAHLLLVGEVRSHELISGSCLGRSRPWSRRRFPSNVAAAAPGSSMSVRRRMAPSTSPRAAWRFTEPSRAGSNPGSASSARSSAAVAAGIWPRRRWSPRRVWPRRRFGSRSARSLSRPAASLATPPGGRRGARGGRRSLRAPGVLGRDRASVGGSMRRRRSDRARPVRRRASPARRRCSGCDTAAWACSAASVKRWSVRVSEAWARCVSKASGSSASACATAAVARSKPLRSPLSMP